MTAAMTRFGGSPPLRRGLLLPSLLIAAGALALAVTGGALDLHALHMFLHVYWPVLIVLAGIEIALARTRPVLALGIEVVVAVVAAALVLAL